MAVTFFQDFKSDDGDDVTVEYHYDYDDASIDKAWLSDDTESDRVVALNIRERERMEAWLMEHRYNDDAQRR